EGRLPFGSGSNAVAVNTNHTRLYVANGTNNCVVVVELGKKSTGPDRLLGLIPTGWYPGAVLLSPDEKQLFVANVKGHGSLSHPPGPKAPQNKPYPAAPQGPLPPTHLPEHSAVKKFPGDGHPQHPPRFLPGRPGEGTAGSQADAGAAAPRRAVAVRARHLRRQ